MKGIFSERSLDTILSVSIQLDKVTAALDELPESERLCAEIDQLAALVARLDAILHDEEF